jgi:hypothetical protein
MIIMVRRYGDVTADWLGLVPDRGAADRSAAAGEDGLALMGRTFGGTPRNRRRRPAGRKERWRHDAGGKGRGT